MTLTVIDRTTYDTTQFRTPGNGYQARTGALPNKIVIHTTDGAMGSTFEGECSYLSDQYGQQDPGNQVCAPYLIGKQGQCARLLDSHQWFAWAVGVCIPGWSNAETISIELHCTIGEVLTAAQHATLDSLVLELCQVYPIGDLTTSCATHRAIALPAGRKIDPVSFSDLDFGTWRANLQCQRTKL